LGPRVSKQQGDKTRNKPRYRGNQKRKQGPQIGKAEEKKRGQNRCGHIGGNTRKSSRSTEPGEEGQIPQNRRGGNVRRLRPGGAPRFSTLEKRGEKMGD